MKMYCLPTCKTVLPDGNEKRVNLFSGKDNVTTNFVTCDNVTTNFVTCDNVTTNFGRCDKGECLFIIGCIVYI